MDGRFGKPFVGKPEEPGIRPEKMIDTPSSKRSRRAVQKRVVSVPIADADGSRTKGEGAPPSDSWAWRKYGQKPIKGSPYPRGYYRCSSSKGCPARKQVERSRVDPTMLLITYACEHNHPWPTARNSTSTAPPRIPPEKPPPAFRAPPDAEPETDGKLPEMENGPTLLADEFGWFSDVASSPTEIAVLESPIYAGEADDVAEALFPMREEDESLYADLGELPECSLVFRRGFWEREESSLRAETWCGSTG